MLRGAGENDDTEKGRGKRGWPRRRMAACVCECVCVLMFSNWNSRDTDAFENP